VDAAGLGWRPVRCASPRKRLCLSLLLSLLAHALLLSLTFSGQEFGLPGFGFPWQDRRIEVPDLHVVLAPAPLIDPKPAITLPPPAVAAGIDRANRGRRAGGRDIQVASAAPDAASPGNRGAQYAEGEG